MTSGTWYCQVRAWDFEKPLLVAPAMNTFMWDSPFTSKHLATLQELGASIIPPVSVATRVVSQFFIACWWLFHVSGHLCFERLPCDFGLQVSKKLACGDVGNGAMASPDDIAEATKSALEMCSSVPAIWAQKST